jgi:hypothetical protein
MTFASIVLGLIIAAIFGCAFHFWRGGGLRWLILYNLFSAAGFWAGHISGNILNFHFMKLGPINLGASFLGTLLFLFGGYWLSMAGIEAKHKK